MTRFIFVRHGESEANAAYKLADVRSPLTDKGKQQAKDTADQLRQFGITKIACSPILRARQTAEIIAGELGIAPKDIIIIDDLAERDMGELENTLKKHDDPTYYYTTDEPATIEPRAALLARSEKALSQINMLAANEMLLVVGHACSGFYLRQVAASHHTLESFDDPDQIANAGHAEVEIQ